MTRCTEDSLDFWQRLTCRNPVACLSPNTQRRRAKIFFCVCVYVCRHHAALKDRLPALLNTHNAQTGWLTALLSPFPPFRFEKSALQASRRRAEECQETLWRSEPAASEQWRSSHVMREQCMCWGEGGESVNRGKWQEVWCRVKDDKWKFVANVEMSMYIYYIRILHACAIAAAFLYEGLGHEWDWVLKRLIWKP